MRDRTLILSRNDIAELLTIDECIGAVEQAFRLHAQGKSLPPGVLSIPAKDGGFHIKAAGLDLGKLYVAVKVNGNFFFNKQRFGMPNIQGVIILCDGENGYPLAVMDSIEITIVRTGAATAVAARYLARPDSSTATICGCGNQGRIQLRALLRVLPIARVHAFDLDKREAIRFADEVSSDLGIDIDAITDLELSIRQSDVVVTCTPSRQSFLQKEWISPGTFVAAVGADSPDKQELEPELLATNRVVVDVLEQCATIGELHHAIEKGLTRRDSGHTELGDVVAGRAPGRTSQDEIIIFDSTGTALQDVAAAVVVYEKAQRTGKGRLESLLA